MFFSLHSVPLLFPPESLHIPFVLECALREDFCGRTLTGLFPVWFIYILAIIYNFGYFANRTVLSAILSIIVSKPALPS